jgi:hypothetical protein
MVEATTETVNRIISFHREMPDVNSPSKYYKDFITIKPKNMGSLAKFITKAVWSDCIWKEGRRNESSFLFSDYCVLDVDGGYKIDDAANELCDTAHVIATTKSHTPNEHRFRIIMPWTSRIDLLDVYRFNVERRIKKYDADPAGIDGARFFWPCKEVISVVEMQDGVFTEDIFELPANYQTVAEKQRIQMEKHKHMAANGVIADWIKYALAKGCADGERNTTIYSLGKHLTYYGWGYEKILDAVMKSPIPLPSAPKKEIEYAIKSGIKKANKVVRGGRI